MNLSENREVVRSIVYVATEKPPIVLQKQVEEHLGIVH